MIVSTTKHNADTILFPECSHIFANEVKTRHPNRLRVTALRQAHIRTPPAILDITHSPHVKWSIILCNTKTTITLELGAISEGMLVEIQDQVKRGLIRSRG